MSTPLRIVCGRHAVKAALTKKNTPVWVAKNTNQDLVDKIRKQSLNLEIVSLKEILKIAGTQHHQGIVAECKAITSSGWQTVIKTKKNPLILVLDQIQDLVILVLVYVLQPQWVLM